jgi:hypothetical protein
MQIEVQSEAHVHPDPELTHRLAAAWGLDPLEIPDALEYVRARVLAEDGDLALVRVEHRAATDRYLYRWTENPQGPGTLVVERPLGWEPARERAAVADMRQAWAPDVELAREDEEEDQAA